MRAFVRIVHVVALAVLMPTIAFAQATITGTVKDTSGAVLPGVTVEASSPVLIEKVRTVTTDGGGQYRIVDLRPGTYSVTFTLPGFNTYKRDGVELTGAGAVAEGSTHIYTFTVSDPGVDGFDVSLGYPTCGTGGSYVGGSLDVTATGGSFECTFADGPTSTDVAIRVVDSDGASDTDSEDVVIVDVANVDPTVDAGAGEFVGGLR